MAAYLITKEEFVTLYKYGRLHVRANSCASGPDRQAEMETLLHQSDVFEYAQERLFVTTEAEASEVLEMTSVTGIHPLDSVSKRVFEGEFNGKILFSDPVCEDMVKQFLTEDTGHYKAIQGINALYAATQALTACSALRETFSDPENIRFHPIMTEGGASVNIIPSRTQIESYIRGQHIEAILDVKRKIALAVAGSAASIGAGVTIVTRPGYFPAKYDPGMMLAMKEAMEEVLDETYYRPNSFGTGSTDNGDLSAVMPTVQPHIGGAAGHGHGDDYKIVSIDSACVDSAKVQAAFIEILLGNGAKRANEIVRNFKPVFAGKEEYFAFMDKIVRDTEAVEFHDDGTVTLRP